MICQKRFLFFYQLHPQPLVVQPRGYYPRGYYPLDPVHLPRATQCHRLWQAPACRLVTLYLCQQGHVCKGSVSH